MDPDLSDDKDDDDNNNDDDDKGGDGGGITISQARKTHMTKGKKWLIRRSMLM